MAGKGKAVAEEVVPFTLSEAIAAYLYDCWGSMHESASNVPIAHAGGKQLGVFCLDYSLDCRTENLRWLSVSYEKALRSAGLSAVRDMCQTVLEELGVDDSCTDEAKADLVTDLHNELEELLCGEEE